MTTASNKDPLQPNTLDDTLYNILCDVMDWGSSNTKKGTSPEKAKTAISRLIEAQGKLEYRKGYRAGHDKGVTANTKRREKIVTHNLCPACLEKQEAVTDLAAPEPLATTERAYPPEISRLIQEARIDELTDFTKKAARGTMFDTNNTGWRPSDMHAPQIERYVKERIAQLHKGENDG